MRPAILLLALAGCLAAPAEDAPEQPEPQQPIIAPAACAGCQACCEARDAGPDGRYAGWVISCVERCEADGGAP